MTTSSPVVRRRRLGLELKRLREAAGFKGNDVAKALKWSASKLSRLEAGRSTPTPADVTKLLDLYRLDDEAQREKLATLTKEARKKGWWQLYSDIPYTTFIGLEAEAETILTYETVIPGLLQTSQYAEAINRATGPGLTEEALEQRLDVRMQRQQLLTQPSPVQFRAVLDESALCRTVGGPDVMRGQLAHLLDMADSPNVLLQAIPFSIGAHPGTLVGPFVILRFAHPEDPDVLYVEANADPYVGNLQEHEVLFDNLRANAISVPQTLDMIRSRMREL
ncbi:helix-turn-helix domain-containing protein [Streptomyces carpaticus]|uniref:helix-turn-helix domain-containing protein n=1 Tax=Streptomyces TaxID=1883 RepID=UPI001FF7BF5F|nr:helix-turn-helix transcriptional regulator [Streptomyces sp. XM4011]MCK1814787.1 helix-turn-helix domain-containing protein [Streptomyces sp. XM4011]UWM50784.1 helix-turn-helix domain-containing protein [Streptomyces carpaticus]